MTYLESPSALSFGDDAETLAACTALADPVILDHFAVNSATLTPTHHAILIQVARCILARRATSSPANNLDIVGFASLDGSASYNLRLGRRRALAVARDLRRTLERMLPGSSAGIVMNASSRGESSQVAGGAGANRRVAIFLPAAAVTPIVPPPIVPPPIVPPIPVVPSVPTPPTGVRFRGRPCCILAPQVPGRFGVPSSNFREPGRLGTHGASSEENGLVYCGGIGFLDLGHAREHAEITSSVFAQIVAAGAAITSTPIRTPKGVANFSAPPPDPLSAAQAIAVDFGIGHEIFSFDCNVPGMKNSSFSPEDLPSNFIGTLLARQAIVRGGPFNAALTIEIDNFVSVNGGQTEAESLNSFNRINHIWVTFSSVLSLADPNYLRRRNFTKTPMKTGHSSDMATPAFMRMSLAPHRTAYVYTHTESFRGCGSRTIRNTDYAAEIVRIRAAAP